MFQTCYFLPHALTTLSFSTLLMGAAYNLLGGKRSRACQKRRSWRKLPMLRTADRRHGSLNQEGAGGHFGGYQIWKA
jgi:hypothetical protein